MNIIRSLFQNGRRSTTYLQMGNKLRQLIRKLIEQSNSRRAIGLSENYPRLFKNAFARRAFPSEPSRLVEVVPVRPLSSPIKSLEFVSLTLIPVSKRLAEFNKLLDSKFERNGNDSAKELLAEIKESFGISAWLSSEEVLSISDNDEEVSDYLNKLRDQDKLGLVFLLVLEHFVANANSIAVSGLAQHLVDRKYPDELRSLLIAWIHPAPPLSDLEINQVLALSIHYPAIDRYLLLTRCIGAYLATGNSEEKSNVLKSATATLKIVSNVGGLFSTNLFMMLNGEYSQESTYSPHIVESTLVEILTSEKNCPRKEDNVSPLVSALSGLTSSDFGVAGHLAVLAREAVVNSSLRAGTIIASVVSQCASLTERRTRSGVVWARLFGHPSLIAASNGGRVGHSLRMQRVKSRHMELSALVEAANRDAHNEVVALAELHGTIGIDEKAILLDALLALGEDSAAIKCANEIIVDYTASAERLPVADLIELVPTEMETDLIQAIHKSVLAAFCARFDLPGAAVKRNDSLEDVLDCAGVQFPSKAFDKVFSVVSRGVARQFFEHVCQTQIMDTVPVGRSTEELLNERIRILNALRTEALSLESRDPKLTERFDLEMKEHATHLAVANELASLDQRRIYVDTEGLRARLGATLTDDFQRYKRFAAFDIRSDSDLKLLHHLLQEQFPDTVFLGFAEFSRALTSESERALSKMLLDIRDGFAISPEFGLDGYLSGGVRHGNLEGHLREPFVSGNIVGVLRSDGGFEPPIFAQSLLALCRTNEERDLIQHGFKELALNLQALIDEVLIDWIQVDLNETSPNAFFRLSMPRGVARALESQLQRVKTLEEFIDLCIRYWWGIVDKSLELARDRIHEELHERLLSLLRSLERSCSDVIGETLNEVIRNQIGTVTDSIAIAIAKLAEWFRRPAESATGDVEATTAINVCIRLLRGTFSKLDLQTKVVVSPNSARLTRRDFKHWVDIIHVLFTNAAEHGGAGDDLTLRIDWKFEASGISLVVTNALGSSVSLSKVDESLEVSRKRREEEDSTMHLVRTEGKSGLIKALKYARADLRCPDASVRVIRRNTLVEAQVLLPGKSWVKPLSEGIV